MKQTPNIGLTEVGNSYIDKDMDFEEWRLLIAGEDSSNMSIIDKELGDLKRIIKKDGNGQKFLSDDSTYRYISGGGGTSKVAFASDNYLVYTATEDTTTFTIANMSTSKAVELIKDNMVMMQGQDYDIDKSTGIVTLSYTLNNGEKIYYSVIEGEEKAILYSDDGEVEANREKCLTDINGNFIAPKTTIDAVDGLGENISTIGEQINDLNELTKNLTEDGIDLSPYLANGWTKDEWYALKAYKVGKIVFVCGVINNGVTTAGTQVFQGLPEELRNSWRAPIVCGNGVTMVGYPDGSIILPYAHSVTQITLSSFYRLDM